MKTLLKRIGAAFFLAALASPLYAFDQCDQEFADTQDLRWEIYNRATVGGPVKYRDEVDRIRLYTSESEDRIIPYAVQTPLRAIVLPSNFPPLLCRVVLAMYLSIEGIQPEDFQMAASEAASCFEDDLDQTDCLTDFAHDLETRYGDVYAELSERMSGVAVGIFRSTLFQIAMHEYAHHFLDHFDRIASGQIERIDAEFEADYFAIMNGVQHGEPVSSMYYFFAALADIERYTDALVTPRYESGTCRALNVENITGAIGVAPMIIMNVAYGGQHSFGTLDVSDVEAYRDELFGSGVQPLQDGSCGRIAETVLSEAFLEMRTLYDRVAAESTLLMGDDLDADTTSVRALLADLIKLSQEFEFVNGVSAASASLILRKRNLEGYSLKPFVGAIDALTESEDASANLLSGDFGRLLQAQGLSVIQERTNLPLNTRLDEAFALLERAVYYNPIQSEAWMNMALIDFKRGNCADAALYSENALRTLNPGEDPGPTEFFMSSMQQLSADPEACIAEAASFPYPDIE